MAISTKGRSEPFQGSNREFNSPYRYQFTPEKDGSNSVRSTKFNATVVLWVGHRIVYPIQAGSIPVCGAKFLSRIRLAAMPPRLGRGFRRFESFMRDQVSSMLILITHG